MEMNCQSGAMCLFSFSRLRFTQKLQRKCMSKLSVLFQKTDRQQLFMVRTLIDRRNDFKMLKTLQVSFQHFEVISMVDKSTDNGKLLPIVN